MSELEAINESIGLLILAYDNLDYVVNYDCNLLQDKILDAREAATRLADKIEADKIKKTAIFV